MTDAVDPALAAALDELGDAPLDEFVTTRDRLARGLKAAGSPDAAATLRRRRRPSVVAWSVNRVARARGDLVDALYAAADDVRAAVERSDGDALRAAMRAQRARIAELTGLAVAQAADASPNPSAHEEAIARTWEAAAGDDTLRDDVAAGLLSTDLQPGATVSGTPAAFSGARPASPPTGAAKAKPTIGRKRPASSPNSSTASPPSSGSLPARAPARRGAPRDELAVRRAEEAVAAAREELADARAAASEADADVARATRVATRAHDARQRAERRVARAEQTLAERRSR